MAGCFVVVVVDDGLEWAGVGHYVLEHDGVEVGGGFG